MKYGIKIVIATSLWEFPREIRWQKILSELYDWTIRFSTPHFYASSHTFNTERILSRKRVPRYFTVLISTIKIYIYSEPPYSGRTTQAVCSHQSSIFGKKPESIQPTFIFIPMSVRYEMLCSNSTVLVKICGVRKLPD